ncbi:serine/threonine protein kinase [Microbacterium sp. zg.Y625]|uniref:serine/threonine-protein kinase n=1 Tax=Microbacterium jiangjiandongii TaxID=3049071 RepID=UPI00214ADD9A|nr:MULTISPECIES: serine/threonine-protein kinase [unclassified Microbacterium]MCR2791795.1 serine/threonine protein kinase [Microbacterium sp. zg.Y625]WIM24612.1 serine/threonine-protein kinase [Microbacterium sp. zg-Y625]
MIDARVTEIAEGTVLERRYQLRKLIGSGGAGKVFRGDDLHLQRPIAVKVMHPHADDLGSVDRARAEMLVLASLNHPCLVTLFDARISHADDDVNYLVMEYVPGLTLSERLRQGEMDARELAGIALDIAEGLHVAHASGIVHRDIKPSNVLLWRSPLANGRWRAKVADFGIAYLQNTTRATAPGLVIGTAAYLAPEQARGTAATPAADIYALGILLIEAITGHRPYSDASGIGAITARLIDPPAVPASLPAPWRELLQAMTAMRPEDRPSALEVAVAAARLTVPDAIASDTATPVAPVASVTAVAPVPPQTEPMTRRARARAAAATAATAPLQLPTVTAPRSASSAVSARRTDTTVPEVPGLTPVARPAARYPRRVYAAAAGVGVLAVLSVSAFSAVIGASVSQDPAPVVQEEPAPVEPAPVVPVEPAAPVAPAEEAPAIVAEEVEAPAPQPIVVTPVDAPADKPGPANLNKGPGNNSGNGGGPAHTNPNKGPGNGPGADNPNRGPGNNNGNGKGNR